MRDGGWNSRQKHTCHASIFGKLQMNFLAAGADALLRSTRYRRGFIGIRRRSGRARIARGIRPGDEILVNEKKNSKENENQLNYQNEFFQKISSKKLIFPLDSAVGEACKMDLQSKNRRLPP